MTVALYELANEPGISHELVGVYTDGEGWSRGGERFAHTEDYPRDLSEQFLMDMYDTPRLFGARIDDDATPAETYDGSTDTGGDDGE
jgi:hypothetical protein